MFTMPLIKSTNNKNHKYHNLSNFTNAIPFIFEHKETKIMFIHDNYKDTRCFVQKKVKMSNKL